MIRLLHKSSFYNSAFIGVIIWFILFLITPVSIVNPIAKETLAFVFLNFLALIMGYALFPKKITSNLNQTTFSNKLIYIIILIVLVSFTLRYIDLFVFRKLSITNSIAENRRLIVSTKPTIFFIIASVLKQSFFVPLILHLANKKENKFIFYATICLFLLPFIEGVMRGSRNIFFFSFVLLVLILAYFKKVKFTTKQVLIYCITIILLFITATSLLMKREGKEKSRDVTILVSDAIYSDFLKTNETAANYILSIKNPTTQKLAISGLQFGQYYTHGFFEFDNLVKHYQKNKLTTQKGKFMFFTFSKFTNKYNLTNIDLNAVQMTHPRGFTFITLFGGLFLDFGWLSILVMFLFGVLQKHIQNKISSGFNEYIPLFLIFMFLNFFMLTFNFIKGQGTYNVVVCVFLILAIRFIRNTKLKLNEGSYST